MTRLRLALAVLCSAMPAPAATLVVGAAASLKDALTVVGAAFEAATPGTKVAFNFASSSAIVQQILGGAALDAFVAADAASMDRVAAALLPDTRQDVLAGELALVVTSGARTAAIKGLADLTNAAVKTVAVCDEAVPAGHYARGWLTKHGLLAALTPKIVKPENVRSALAMVASGTAEAGFVYVTDALIEKDRVRVAQRATAADGVDVRYPAAVLRRTRHAATATQFVAYLRSDAARAAFTKFGFKPL